MPHRLHAALGEELVASWELSGGTHVVGSGSSADLILDAKRCPDELCQIEVRSDGSVVVFALGEGDVRRGDGGVAANGPLVNCGSVGVGDYRLALVVESERGALVVERGALSPMPTEGDRGKGAPVGETLAIKVTVEVGSVLELLVPPTTLVGRGVGNRIDITHPEVSRRHCRFYKKGSAWWVEDLQSLHGTFLDGRAIHDAAVGPNALLTLGTARDAPRLLCLTAEEAMATPLDDDPAARIKGKSDGVRAVRERIRRYGPLDETLLITGETGVGKQLVAEALCKCRNPRHRLITVDCGALAPSVIESELFGNVKGAFTDAKADRQGPFELAQGSTVFLDEIGELPLAAQTKLLRVVQEREVRRVGGTHPIPVHFRLVCATHQNLPGRVKEGSFRRDLYERIHVLEIDVPPLRLRKLDIPAIAQDALRKLRGKQRDRTLTGAALEKLSAQAWPGNVRQLLNVLRRAVANTDSPEIDAKDLEIQTASELRGNAVTESSDLPDDLRADALARERALCEATLRAHHGNLAAAARSLKLTRQSLRRRLERFGLL